MRKIWRDSHRIFTVAAMRFVFESPFHMICGFALEAESLTRACTRATSRSQCHASVWFKSVDGGRELASKVISLGAWATLKPAILPFLNAIRGHFRFAELKALPGE